MIAPDGFFVWKHNMKKPKAVCPHCGNEKTEYYTSDESWYCPICNSEWDERDNMWWDIYGGHLLEEA